MEGLSVTARVWVVDLDRPDRSIDESIKILSTEERARAARLVRAVDRERWIVARSALRTILGSIVGRDPRGLVFATGREGKPTLKSPMSDFRFNLSHSGGLAVVAVISGSEIGVDIEEVRDVVEVDALARRHFSAKENDYLMSAAGEKRRRRFFEIWSRREAVVKCVGEGLPSFSGKSLITETEDLQSGREWRWCVNGMTGRVTPLKIGEKFASALAVTLPAGENRDSKRHYHYDNTEKTIKIRFEETPR